jgi:hypothetical protein
MNEPAGVTKRAPALAWGLCIVALVTLIGGSILSEVLDHGDEGGLIEDIGLLVGFASFSVIGAFIASRQSRNPLGWIFVGIGVGIGMLVLGTEYAFLAFVKEPGGYWPGATLAAWLGEWLWYPSLILIPTLGLLLFPNGRPPSERWNWVAWASGALIAIISGGAMFQSSLKDEGYSLDNPVGFLPFADGEKALEPVFLLVFPLMFLCLASLVVRYRHSGAEQRQQLKLLMWASVSFGVAVFLGDTFDLPEVIFPLTLWMIPGAIGVAILKYRLYDIDLIINRTLVYGALTTILGLVYFGIIVLLQSALGDVTEQNDLAIAGSTLAVAGLFRPLRGRVQTFIDQRFYRRKYDARQTLESFSSRLRDEVDLDHLALSLSAVVSETMQPAHVSVWLRPPGSTGAVAS